ncbi:MAG: chorismate synthase [Oscillospiraceae bacterium]|nr:chorismate synthase [Oscillospiraceae bacterium]
MAFTIGDRIKLTIFGQSHAPSIGGVIDGLPAGETIDLDAATAFLARRSPGKSPLATARKETDVPRVIAGLADGKTCGAPLAFFIENHDTRSKDYDLFRAQPRPSHADFPAILKYGDAHDIRGGGFFSARLTAALCFAGAIALQILARRGIVIGAHIARAAGIADTPFDPVNLTKEDFSSLNDFPVIDKIQGEKMQKAIISAKKDGDSVGGVVECGIIGLPAGLGEPIFDSMESQLARMLFAIPAVKGVEFGTGFAIADMMGSAANDVYTEPQGDSLRTLTNNNGGILGGLSTGMPLIFRAAFKPTPSIARKQNTWNTHSGKQETLVIPGRHDPCVVLRAVPCVKAAAGIVVLSCSTV